MNNCPKCGNPLQVGTTSCPICGTNITNTAPAAKEEVKTTVTVATVAQPAAPASQPSPAPVAPAAPAATPAPAAQAAPAASVKVEVAPAVQPAQAPVASAPAPAATPAPAPAVAPAQAAPVAPAKAEATPAVQTAPAVEQTTPAPAPVDPNAIAPTIKPVEVGTPVPSIPASVNPEISTIVTTTADSVKIEQPKKKINKNVLVIAGVLAIAIIAGVLLMSMGGGTKLNTNTNTNAGKNSALNITAVSTNGYKFNLEEGWMVTEDGTNVIITNKDETVAIKLDSTKSGLNTISKSTIEGFFASRTDFTNTTVTETTISAKDAYLVNTQINQAMVQLYYINGGSNLTLGATIVYQSSETKKLYEANVTELIGSLSYSDDSIKALSSLEMYSNIFGVYNGVFQYQPSVEQPAVENNGTVNGAQNEEPSEENTGNTETPVPENPTE